MADAMRNRIDQSAAEADNKRGQNSHRLVNRCRQDDCDYDGSHQVAFRDHSQHQAERKRGGELGGRLVGAG